MANMESKNIGHIIGPPFNNIPHALIKATVIISSVRMRLHLPGIIFDPVQPFLRKGGFRSV